jgi:hypothetical protein
MESPTTDVVGDPPAEQTASIFSKRAVVRFADLHYQFNQEVQRLGSRHSHFMGALMACDQDTQRAMMLAYRDQLHAIHVVLSHLCVVIDKYGNGKDSGQ